MMLSKADFEEIFPDLFRPTERALAQTPEAANAAECIARWEDEGGGLCSKMHRRAAPALHTAGDGHAGPDHPLSTSSEMVTCL